MKHSLLQVFAFIQLIMGTSLGQTEFPSEQPLNANFNRPLPGEVLDVSPPGFCWWRAAPRNKVSYRLSIESEAGERVYQSGLLRDPVHVPSLVLPEGNYRWFVDALDKQQRVLTTRPAQYFNIAKDAYELPWIDPGQLLNRVPSNHPRLLFPHAKLLDIRASLEDSRSEAYSYLRKVADQSLRLELMEKPDFDKYDKETEYPMRRTAYRASYHKFTAVYNRGMISLALTYLLTGEKKYGHAAKKHLLNVLDWELDGIASLEEGFDEIGLRIARTSAQGYDWLYDLLTGDEREAIRQMLLARGDQMLARLERRDFLHKSAYSHDGRLPGYLVEFAIVLAEEERAQIWMDYAMRALLTVFPHWGGKDGGWAEGINYVLSYNDRFITPLQSLKNSTGYNLWKKSYFRNMRYFLMYCTSPLGEITPFGDAEHNALSDRAGDLYSILHFHSLQYQDPQVRWWIEELAGMKEKTTRLGVMHRLILEDDLSPEKPEFLPPDKAFFGVGWAALHTDILDPKNDLMILFKSSPFGPVSHSHADQNSFAIMKGGKALAQPSGARYPQHQSPFHFEYTNLTIAHNALLINGKGQIDRDATAHGQLVDFKSTEHLGYVVGDAQKCYGNQLDKFERHVIMIRPSVILVIDDLSASKPFSVDWLMHGREQMVLHQNHQLIESSRYEEGMKTHLVTSGMFDFSLSNEWPIDPKQDYPMVTTDPPPKEWHLAASTREMADQRIIVAVMMIKEDGKYPACEVSVNNDHVTVSGYSGADEWTGTIRISNDQKTSLPLLNLEYHLKSGEVEKINIPD
ncbi:MAG: DUF4962 domain-containing protein [Saprospiraceae bacterium]|nr:DUF4962 domain-containing protein [Saprospiraceae bacterium]